MNLSLEAPALLAPKVTRMDIDQAALQKKMEVDGEPGDMYGSARDSSRPS